MALRPAGETLGKAKQSKKESLASNDSAIERHVYFYRINPERGPSGAPTRFDVGEILDTIGKLDFNNEGRIQPFADGSGGLACWVERPTHFRHAQIGTMRKNGLPRLTDCAANGAFSDLGLKPNQFLTESTHMVFFPRGLVGAEMNGYGPRAGRIESYFRAKAPDCCPPFTLDPIVRKDMLVRLASMESLVSIDMQLTDGAIDAFAQEDATLAEKIRSLKNELQAESIAVRFGPKLYGRKARLTEASPELVERLLKNSAFTDQVERFEVEGIDRNTQQRVAFDLFSNQIVATKKFIRESPGAKSVDSPSAYKAIEEAYREMKDDIEAGESLTLL